MRELIIKKLITKTVMFRVEAKNEVNMKWFLDRLESFRAQIVVDLPYTKIKVCGDEGRVELNVSLRAK